MRVKRKVRIAIVLMAIVLLSCVAARARGSLPMLFATEVTDVQRLQFVKDEIKEKLDNGIKTAESDLAQRINPLLNKCMKETSGSIDVKSQDGLSVLDFLSPKIGTYSNPTFDYCLWHFMASKAFQNSPIEKKRETLSQLLKMATDEQFEMFHRSIVNSIVMYCIESELYCSPVAEQINNLVENMLLNKHKSLRSFQCVLLLVRIDNSRITSAVVSHLKKEAKKCNRFTIYESKSLPFAATVVLASMGDKDNLRKLLSFMHENGKFIDMESAKYLFPYVTLVKRREVVLLLKEYLRSDLEVDNGEDIMNRYEGYSSLAAASLYVMLDCFPEPPEEHCTKEYRDRCLAFLSSEEKVNFKKNIDWSSSNYIISRIRYMIFGL